ncbi:hypothetical protein E8E12_001355 [Didymella heteroderae]|uniref:Uncharacterized protein n=1 Tax=Didymella heteroderae TaxID=1769908 RepID=A0A9P4WG09_9PLEO|nr:hypothetical protein E8E12_001355 [Didymella heteroderae]
MTVLSLSTLVCFGLALSRTVASGPEVGVLVHPSGDGISINIDIIVETADMLANTSIITGNVTHGLPDGPAEGSATQAHEQTTHGLCASGGPAAARNATSWTPTAATQGFFNNSTGVSSATGAFRTPSVFDAAAFSSGFAARSPPDVSLLVALVSSLFAASRM